MPYVCRKNGNKWELTKKNATKSFGTHDSEESCKKQMRALYASEMSNSENIQFNGAIYSGFDLDLKIQSAKDNINVIINSKGGDLFEALAIHNKLRGSGKKVVCYVNPFAFSAAAIVALAGDEVYMVENGLMFFHVPKAEVYGIKDSKQLEMIVDGLKRAEESLVNTLCSKTGKTEEECKELVRSDTWLTPKEAMNLGIVNEIIPIRYNDVKVENFFPDRIVAFVKENNDMSIKELCEKIGLSSESTEEDVVKMVNDLKASAEKKPEEKKLEDKGGNKEGKSSEVPLTIINMVKRSRETEINALVSEGKITAAVAGDLKLQFASSERIVNDVNNDDESFNQMITAISKNESVVKLHGKSGIQFVPKNDGDKESLVLVNDMKERVEALKVS